MISKDKEYRLDSRDIEHRIYATDGYGTFPVHGAVRYPHGWEPAMWTAEGRGKNCPDLIEVKPRIKRTVWLNVYADGISPPVGSGMTREDADRLAGTARVACIPVEIDCEEGEGL